ncbi:DNA primase [Macellibacteroides fermentans]|uniref:DNA primase n=1 Tax=Macellibacteroides fermentans TaxID=879969 RepID=A0A8E2A311_9PORP|nr:DNA primase [Macellibacteroides fermentans]NYI49908.1 DNA primase [Macellibacteroides fermentans]
MKKHSKQSEFVEDHLTLETVVNWYGSVHFKSNGKALMRCPFHNDTHPSLKLDNHKGLWHCFPCGKGGDKATFVMEKESCSYPEALKLLCARHGGPSDQSSESTETKGPIYENPIEFEGFFAPLETPKAKQKAPEPEATPEQLRAMEQENRAFANSCYGYVPDCGGLSEAYVNFGVRMVRQYPPQGFTQFKGRIAFPIHNERGILVGFTCRYFGQINSVGGKGIPKYINSANNALYNKSRVIYGLYQAIDHILSEGLVHMVEGPKDCIAMHAAGYQNTVALCGSALSDEQIELLKRYARRVSLVLDGDEAGQNAAARIEKQLADAGFMVMNCLLPEGEDPDSLFHRYGKEGFCTIFRESAYNRRVKKFGGTLDDESGESDIRVALFCDDELEVIALHQQNLMERPRLERLEAEIRMEMDHLMGILFYTTNKPERTEVLQRLVHASKRLNILYKELNRPHGTYNKQIRIK